MRPVVRGAVLLVAVVALLAACQKAVERPRDRSGPTVTGVQITSTPQAGGVYRPGETLEVKVTFSEPVRVSGSPRLRLIVGAHSRIAGYRRAAGSSVWFSYRLRADDWDADGIAIPGDALSLSGGTIRDAAGNAAQPALGGQAIADDRRHRVAPANPVVTAVQIVSAPADRLSYRSGETVRVQLTFSEPVTVTGSPVLALTVGAATRPAGYSHSDGRRAIFSYTVTEADQDQNGISVAADALSLAGGAIRSAAGTDAVLGLGALAFTDNAVHRVGELTMPAVIGAAFTSTPAAGDSYRAGETITVQLTFSEPVTVTGSPLLALTVGAAARPAAYAATAAATADARVTFSYTVAALDRDEDGISVGHDALSLAGGTIRDADGLDALLELGAHTLADDANHKVGDLVAPAVEGVALTSTPAVDDTYLTGETITVQVTFSEPVAVTGTPQLALTVGAAMRPAAYSATADDSVTFSYTVAGPDRDDDGVSVAADALSLDGGSIRDAAGNAALLELGEHAIADAAAHKVAVGLVGSYAGSGDQVFVADLAALVPSPPPSTVEFTLSLDLGDLGSSTAEVLLVATNSTAAALSPPRVALAQQPQWMRSRHAAQLPRRAAADDLLWAPSGRPEVTAFNHDPPPLSRGGAGGARRSLVGPRRAAAVGDTFTFEDNHDATSRRVPATARATVSLGGSGISKLTVWVADDCWDDPDAEPNPCTKSNCVTQAMADAVAAKVMASGSDNDLFEWLTAIFGQPWGSHSFNNIVPGDTDEIHLLLLDVDADNATRGTVTLGFFHSKDNYLRSAIAKSNERLMVYVDAVLVAQATGSSWEITDRLPKKMLSTIAHELQHMIHWYQKRVVIPPATAEIWLDEMSSEVAEDLVASKLEYDGPRGVAHDDPTAGSAGITAGRLPDYLAANDIQVTYWPDSGSALDNYAINYAFGAYLARTYGGPRVFQEIVQNRSSGTAAVEAAVRVRLNRPADPPDFGELLLDWGVATLLSDNTQAPEPYRYNTGAWRQFTIGFPQPLPFKLGSINLYHYQSGTQVGPKVRTVAQLNQVAEQPAHSNFSVTLGEYRGGTVRAAISSAPVTRIAFVVKET